MPVLLLVVVVLLAVLAAALLYPFALVQRYRFGKARRRARPWVVRINAGLLAASTVAFLAGAWFGGHWIAHALPFAACGWLAGMALGIVGIWITRFEHGVDEVYYTPNRWLVLALTLLLAGRIALSLWQAWRAPPPGPLSWWDALAADHATVFAIAGVLLGYTLAYAWRLLSRLPHRPAAPRTGRRAHR